MGAGGRIIFVRQIALEPFWSSYDNLTKNAARSALMGGFMVRTFAMISAASGALNITKQPNNLTNRDNSFFNGTTIAVGIRGKF